MGKLNVGNVVAPKGASLVVKLGDEVLNDSYDIEFNDENDSAARINYTQDKTVKAALDEIYSILATLTNKSETEVE